MRIWVPVVFALLLISPAFADLQANSTISPRYVDTSVINQTFVYTIVPVNNESINRTVIYAPAGYQIVNITDVRYNTSNPCLGESCVVGFNRSEIEVNFTPLNPINNGTVNNQIVVTFLVNTSSSMVIGNFSSIVNNSVYNNQTRESAANYTVVITQQIINVTGITVIKNTAILNGTDYWEFKFTMAFTASVAGAIQLRMNDWLDSVGQRLNLNTSMDYYATLRNDTNFNTTGKFNVTTTYGAGINKTAATDYYLRMLIPTSAPLSNGWSTTYNFLFRASP